MKFTSEQFLILPYISYIFQTWVVYFDVYGDSDLKVNYLVLIEMKIFFSKKLLIIQFVVVTFLKFLFFQKIQHPPFQIYGYSLNRIQSVFISSSQDIGHQNWIILYLNGV